jgi:hypothetical protein
MNMATSESKTHTRSVKNSERTAFRVGEKVEWDGKLAKVIAFGYLEQTTNPGEDASFSKELEAHLQLPAASPGGKPDVARHVPATEITSLRDNPKRQRELEIEFNALFGDPVPVDPSKESAKGPEIHKSPRDHSKAALAKAGAPAETVENPTPLRAKTSVQDEEAEPAKTSRKSSRKASK